MSIAAFAAPTLGMLTQSSAFGTISQNISNVNTGGYRATDTRFNTVFASQFGNNNDIGGVTANRKQYVDTQGQIISTSNNLDLAIAGHGMFVVNTEADGSGDTRYTRDGGFQIKVNGTDSQTVNGVTSTINKGYLADKNGNYVLGWTPEADGTFLTTGTPVPIRLDQFAFTSEAAATSSASIAINLPANADPGTVQKTTQSVYDSTGALHSFQLAWTKTNTPQEWTVRVLSDDAGESEPDSNIVGASTTPSLTTTPITLDFGSDGHLPDDPTTEPLSITYSDGTALSFNLDVTDVTSLSDHFINFNFQKDGRAPGELKAYHFDDSGTIVGDFTNGQEQPLYKLPLATFVNEDGLTPLQGNEYTESVTSGTATLRQVKDPAVSVDPTTGNNQEKSEFASFVPFSHELSNVNLSNEFTLMIMTQQAYNSNATVFKTVDEMTKVAEGLKS